MVKHRRKRLKKGTVKLYLAITLVCFLLAALLYFIIDKGSNIMEEVKEITEIDLNPATVKKLQEAYQEKPATSAGTGNEKKHDLNKNPTDLEKALQAYGKKISDDELEKLKQKAKEYGANKR